ncbi:hypothetical protein [Aeoliella sp.]|uniref:hypothetical protein n=1 Tax=Aeoliella sp. TaxID=2795800 RepID=UPI003CCB93F9
MPDEEARHPQGRVDLGTLRYPAHVFSPESLLNFTELRGFQADWSRLDLNVEDDLGCLQAEIMADPLAGDVIPGTGGLRKLRFSPPNWDCGKRGALRVLYVYFPDCWHVLLVMAYAKKHERPFGVKARSAIKSLIQEERIILSKRHFK